MSLDFIATFDSHSALIAAGPLAHGFIGALVIGFFAGLIAKLIVGGREPAGCLITIIIGIVGSFLALYLGKLLGLYQDGQAPGFIASVIGAIVLLVIYHLIVGRRGGSGPTV